MNPSTNNTAADAPGSEPVDRLPELIAWFRSHPTVVVAFSGGVDSSVVLAASLASGSSTLAITADSPSVARWQLELAKRVATELGAKHKVIATEEIELPQYRANDASRCFHCKSTLYSGIHAALEFAGDDATLVSGTNADDLGDHRPGIQAGRNANVQTPLADLGIGKPSVRALARQLGLSNADLPASPCLASRIAYGVEVTSERLARVEAAEAFLRSHGLEDLRVRLHEGELARIEVPLNRIAALTTPSVRSELVTAFRQAGFEFVTLDLEGFSSGSLNRSLVTLNSMPKKHDQKTNRESHSEQRGDHSTSESNIPICSVSAKNVSASCAPAESNDEG